MVGVSVRVPNETAPQWSKAFRFPLRSDILLDGDCLFVPLISDTARSGIVQSPFPVNLTHQESADNYVKQIGLRDQAHSGNGDASQHIFFVAIIRSMSCTT